MKQLVKSTGPHMYLDLANGQQVNAFRPSVIERTVFTQTLLAAQKIDLISASLKDEATDEEFAKYVADSDGNVDLAVSSFVKTFNPVEKVAEPAPKAATAKAGK
jgi:hypothetical protein